MTGDRSIVLRDARDADVACIQQMYAFYVLNSLATFEETPPTEVELVTRKKRILQCGLPYLAATIEERVVGYAYASPYRPRPAYRFTVEDSVYVDQHQHGKGIGTALLSGLIERCEAGPWKQMVAIIGDSGNAGSLALHARMGFQPVGTLKAVGFKLGRWVDTVILQRGLGTVRIPT
jgi:L-amino acid N-acyltransferase YncA